jgi:hypothetical protein
MHLSYNYGTVGHPPSVQKYAELGPITQGDCINQYFFLLYLTKVSNFLSKNILMIPFVTRSISFTFPAADVSVRNSASVSQ